MRKSLPIPARVGAQPVCGPESSEGPPNSGLGRSVGRLSLKGRALRLLAAREHSRAELERKLAPHAQEPEELSRILDELQAKGFISEQRVLESVLHSRAARFGSARIAHELNLRGLNPQSIHQALSELQGTELDRARALWLRKYKEASTDPRERARQIRFLMGRGFSPEVARKVTG